MHDIREELLETPALETPALETPAQQHKLVAIITERRSGSSWLGSLFQPSDDILYVFEPLHPNFAYKNGNKINLEPLLNSNETLDILSQLCTCSFVARNLNAFGMERQQSITKYNLREENNLGKQHMEDFCQRYKITMPKCIRLFDIQLFQDLLGRNCSSWQVIHLIRDPRAVLRSRILTFRQLNSGRTSSMEPGNMTYEMIMTAASELCNHGLHNNELSRQPWLHDRYHLVRYEDIVSDPHGTVQELYSFINIPVSEAVSQFLSKSSQGDTVKGHFEAVVDRGADSSRGRTSVSSGDNFIIFFSWGKYQMKSKPLMLYIYNRCNRKIIQKRICGQIPQ